MWGRRFVTSLVLVSAFAISAGAAPAHGVGLQSPSFASCLAPQGTVKAHYETGVHGIVGDYGKYEGADTVYLLNDEQAYQCFCPPSGAGIQTNWWMVPHMDKFQKEEFIKQGWIDVPTGSPWGLKNKPYLAKNVSYSCLATSGGGSTGGGGGTSGGNSASAGQATSHSSVPGLASTGTLLAIYHTALIGALFIVGGYLLKKSVRA